MEVATQRERAVRNVRLSRRRRCLDHGCHPNIRDAGQCERFPTLAPQKLDVVYNIHRMAGAGGRLRPREPRTRALQFQTVAAAERDARPHARTAPLDRDEMLLLM